MQSDWCFLFEWKCDCVCDFENMFWSENWNNFITEALIILLPNGPISGMKGNILLIDFVIEDLLYINYLFQQRTASYSF